MRSRSLLAALGLVLLVAHGAPRADAAPKKATATTKKAATPKKVTATKKKAAAPKKVAVTTKKPAAPKKPPPPVVIADPLIDCIDDDGDGVDDLEGFPCVVTTPKPAAPAPTAGPLTYIKFVEPSYRAFEAEVPRGWTVTGGTVRGDAPTDWRHGLLIESPDRRVHVRTGDTRIPVFSEVFSLPLTTAPYQTGVQYAESYVRGPLSGCANVTIDKRTSRPDLVSEINRVAPQAPGGSGFEAGEVFYTCQDNGSVTRGYLVSIVFWGKGALTTPKVWQVFTLYGIRAPEAQFTQGLEVLRRFDRTFKYGEAWLKQVGLDVMQTFRQETARQKGTFELLQSLTPVWTGIGGKG